MGIIKLLDIAKYTKGAYFQIVITHIIVTKNIFRAIEHFRSLLPHTSKQSSRIQNDFYKVKTILILRSLASRQEQQNVSQICMLK